MIPLANFFFGISAPERVLTLKRAITPNRSTGALFEGCRLRPWVICFSLDPTCASHVSFLQKPHPNRWCACNGPPPGVRFYFDPAFVAAPCFYLGRGADLDGGEPSPNTKVPSRPPPHHTALKGAIQRSPKLEGSSPRLAAEIREIVPAKVYLDPVIFVIVQTCCISPRCWGAVMVGWLAFVLSHACLCLFSARPLLC